VKRSQGTVFISEVMSNWHIWSMSQWHQSAFLVQQVTQ